MISKYSPRTKDGAAFVDSRFYSTVRVIRTMETLLGLPPMNNNDASSSMMSSLLPVGIYRVTYDAPGFQEKVVEGL